LKEAKYSILKLKFGKEFRIYNIEGPIQITGVSMSRTVYVLIVVLLLCLLTLGPGVVGEVSNSSVAANVQPSSTAVIPELRLLLNDSNVGPLQAGKPRPKPKPFVPEDPLDLTGPMPFDEEISGAVREAIDYIISEVKQDGSWDPKFSGQIMSRTADQAVDAVVATAMCGLALRQNVHYDPQRLEPIIYKAADFVMDRISRGKLSTRVSYAVWRYNFGIKFLTAEYNATKDRARKIKLKEVTKKMMQSLIEMQYSKESSSGGLVNRKRLFTDKPAHLGIRAKIDSEGQDSLGANVLEVMKGSAAAKAGVKKGDSILSLNDIPVNSSYDYYDLVVRFRAGDQLELAVQRGDEVKKIKVKVAQIWPGNLGFDSTEGNKKGVVIIDLDPTGGARKAGMTLGDTILKIGKTKIKKLEDVAKSQKGLLSGEKVKIKYIPKGEKKSESITIVSGPIDPGTFGLNFVEEDKSGKDGAVVQRLDPGSTAGQAGIRKRDRIIALDNIAIKGRDHFYAVEAMMWGNKKVQVTYSRKGEVNTIEIASKPYNPTPALGINFGRSTNGTVGEVYKGTPAARGGIKVGDRIAAIDGKEIEAPNQNQKIINLVKNMRIGQVVTFKMERKKEFVELDIELTTRTASTFYAARGSVGGWNYYAMGTSMTFVTGTVLITVLEARDTMKLDIPKKVLESAYKLVSSLKSNPDKLNGNARGFGYDGRFVGRAIDIRGCMGRITCCELALYMGTKAKVNSDKPKSTQADVRTSVELFLKHRGELDKVRFYPSPHYYPLFANAAYFWFYGHYHTAKAAHFLKDETLKKETRNTILKALIATRRPNGTWRGHISFGPLTGTAQALHTFGELKGSFHDGLVEVHPLLSKVQDQVNELEYGKAYLALKEVEAENSFEDGTDEKQQFDKGKVYLNKIVQDRLRSRVKFSKKAWDENPTYALKEAESAMSRFEGVDEAKQFEELIKEWKDSPLLKEYESLKTELDEVMAEIKKGGMLLKKTDANKLMERLQKIVDKGKENNIAKKAKSEKSRLKKSFKGSGYLGVNLDNNFKGPGAKLSSVTAGSAAAAGKLKVGDIVLKVGDTEIKNGQGLVGAIKKTKPGEEIEVQVKRKDEDKPITLKVVLGRRP